MVRRMLGGTVEGESNDMRTKGIESLKRHLLRRKAMVRGGKSHWYAREG